MKNTVLKILSPFIDIVLSPFTLLAALLMRLVRKMKVSRLPLTKRIFKTVGIFPIADHYYEPLFNDRHLKQPLDAERALPGINWNTEEQIKLLKQFGYWDELMPLPMKKPADQYRFFYDNPSFSGADADYLYCMIRHFKPKRIIEIGSGYSTLMAIEAINVNTRENKSYSCDHICIEPYEMPWLEKTKVTVIRKTVETVDLSFFHSLDKDDFLFIDSSHMIRPQGDVLFEFLNVLPSLRQGVVIHVHDIFSPYDYTKTHLVDEVLFWNEQYLLEAFLSCNHDFSILAALNYLKKKVPGDMRDKLPGIDKFPAHEPGSFWFRKIA